MWRELAAFLSAYYAVRLVYQLALDADQRIVFDRLARQCDRYSRFVQRSQDISIDRKVITTKSADPKCLEYSKLPSR